MEFSALIPKKTLKCFVHKEELELTWQIPLNESRPKETEAVCVNQFHLSLWTSMAICRIMYITRYTHAQMRPRAETRGRGNYTH